MKIYSMHGVLLARDYFEFHYKEYRDEDGSFKCAGSEDFSRQRLRTIMVYEIKENTGLVNRGGYLMWKSMGFVRVISIKDAKLFAEKVLKLSDFKLVKC